MSRMVEITFALAIAILNGGAVDALEPVWMKHMEYDSGFVVGRSEQSRMSPAGLSMSGFDLGGCPRVGDFASDIILDDLMGREEGLFFPVAGAEVHCRESGVDGLFVVVLLRSESWAPDMGFSAHGYFLKDEHTWGRTGPILEARWVSWGKHALWPIVESGLVVRLAFVFEYVNGEPGIEFVGVRSDGRWPGDVHSFVLVACERDSFVLSVSELRSGWCRECQVGASRYGVYKHTSQDVELESTIESPEEKARGLDRAAISILEKKLTDTVASQSIAVIPWVAMGN